MGIGFPIILVLSLLAALAYPLLRRRYARRHA
jgi:hypothetical protein